MDTALSTKTVVGNPTQVGDGTIISPLVDVSFGFAAGGSDMPTTKPKDLFGGGSGGGVTVTPIAFLVITAAGDVRLMQVSG
ncbi:MAG: GerW family sporulation protein, partial [Lachnospiraceae bacterium]|nr:GerW family sporulation protein [Lachnospiraceae bacterium]